MCWRYASVLVAAIVVVAAYGVRTAQTAGAEQATPWSDRGWVDKGNMTYDNPKHGFHLIVPPNWVIDKKEQSDATFLWSMKKFNAAGNQRVAFAIKVCLVSQRPLSTTTTTSWPASSSLQLPLNTSCCPRGQPARPECTICSSSSP